MEGIRPQRRANLPWRICLYSHTETIRLNHKQQMNAINQGGAILSWSYKTFWIIQTTGANFSARFTGSSVAKICFLYYNYRLEGSPT